MKTRIAIISLIGLLLGGCAGAPSQPPQALPEPLLEQPPKAINGAIYQAGYDVRLYEDRTARRVGDIVTVTLDEKTDASKDANTQLGRQYTYALPTPTLLGKHLVYNGTPVSFDVDSKQDFKGGGSSTQSNALSGVITATVIRVKPNGNLVIQGQKKLTLNRGDEYVTITGEVRPDDLSADNTVSSTRVANARISYTGDGALADSSTVGWLTRLFLSIIWPF
ncbi:MAG TPA: flagellar basal body L-ring protein FlgH [Nitrococcus sp.]|nr:flagellar basal body L-ring protein FlgH [Nitrococcus sp.]